MTADRASDAESRRSAQREFARPLAIEAGAGTGKTATLVARVLAWCLGPGWERARGADPEASDARIAERVLGGVVAITFTEAAAAEMDARVEVALAMLARAERPVGFDADAPADRVVALRGALDHLVVQTIHAWCRRLLAAFPLEAGLHPLFEVDADGSAAAAAAREAVREQLGAAYSRGDAAALALAARGAGPREIEEALREQIEAGVDAEQLAGDPLAAPRIEALRRRLVEAHAALGEAAAGRLATAGGSRAAAAVAAALGRAADLLGAPIPDAATLAETGERLLALWQGTARNALPKWSRGEFGKKLGEKLAERCERVRDAARRLAPLLAHVEQLDVESLAQIAPLLASLCADAERRMGRRGVVSFAMLLTRAAALLHEHPEVTERLRAGIDQLLVDEFQDTDPRQCAIVAALALEGRPDERPGLFVVGDPKQSIYGWRHADLAAYEGFLARLEAAGGRVASLCVNHRSVPAILDEVARVVAPVMGREAGLQPAFAPLVPGPDLEGAEGFAAGPHAPVEHWVAQVWRDGALQKTRASDAAALEAAALTRDLRALHDLHGVPWRGVGVLFRSRGDWDVYLGALREAEIPFAVEGDRTYYRCREILDAAALTACILDPNDTLALVALLRSSIAGVPDAAWIPLFAGELPALAARLGADPAARDAIAALLARAADAIADVEGVSRVRDWHHAAAACLDTVDALRRSFARDPADLFVERVRDATAFELGESARFLGPRRAANLERFFSDLGERLSAGEPVAEVLRRIRSAVAEDESPSAEPVSSASEDAVTVATLHGAKGLAWDHVYLMQLHKRPPPRAGRGAVERVDEQLEARWCGWPTLGCDALEARRRRVEEAERVRTLYVGTTRARRRLVLSGLRPAATGRGLDSHAAMLAARAPAADPAQLARAAAERGGRVDAAHARWVFPALAAPGERAASPPARPATESRPPLAPLAPALAARMSLPRGVAVTALAAEAAPGADGAAPSATGAGDAGRIVGTALHAALERVDLAAGAGAAWSEQRGRIEAEVAAAAPAGIRALAIADALALWDALGRGPLAARLFSLGARVIARELPVLLPPPLAAGTPPATDFVSGAIDLLYRDENDARLVVVDYKSDRVAHAPGSEALARYEYQGALYGSAVADALGLPLPPRFEIWWLRHDRVQRADPASVRSPLTR